MKTWKEQLNEVIAEADIAINSNDGPKMSICASKIALLSFTLVEMYAKANTGYGLTVSKLMDQKDEAGKRMSNAEAERRADAETLSLHDELSLTLEAVDRIGMALKDQIKVWLSEHQRQEVTLP